MSTLIPKAQEEDSLLANIKKSQITDHEPDNADPNLSKTGKKARSKKTHTLDHLTYEDIIHRTESTRFRKYPLIYSDTEGTKLAYDPYCSPPGLPQAEIHAVIRDFIKKANRVGKATDSDFKERCMCCGLATVTSCLNVSLKIYLCAVPLVTLKILAQYMCFTSQPQLMWLFYCFPYL